MVATANKKLLYLMQQNPVFGPWLVPESITAGVSEITEGILSRPLK